MTEELQQRSNLWRQMRLGSVTASRFGDVMTQPKTKAAKLDGEWSETAKTYMFEKLAELLTCHPLDVWTSKATAWGTEWENAAREKAIPVIREKFGCELLLPEGEFAFMQHPTEEYIGCSPDGILGDDGLLEIKCPYNPVNHIRTMISKAMPEKHVEQVQGSLWVTGRQWYAFCSFDHRVEASGLDPLFMVRVDRDDDYINNELAPTVIRFRDELMRRYHQIVDKHQPF